MPGRGEKRRREIVVRRGKVFITQGWNSEGRTWWGDEGAGRRVGLCAGEGRREYGWGS